MQESLSKQNERAKGVPALRITWTILVASCGLFISGCSGVSNLSVLQSESGAVAGSAFQGKVHGGQQPISGAHVYLYGANTSGYGGSSTSLLTSGSGRTIDGSGNYYVTTDGGGNFTITGDYSCPTPTTQVYLYSIGGNPGAGTNSAAGLMAGLGSCGSLTSSVTVVVNEVSTIATAYALAGFATDPTHVSNSGSSQSVSAMAQAFGGALQTPAKGGIANLEVLSTGLALTTTPAGNGSVPQGEIYTLANILAACVNSTGPSSAPCTTLFGNAMNGITQPSDTATAAINIAHNPGANITALYALQTPSAPFQQALTAQPNDFTIAIVYTGGGLDGTGFAPEGIAADMYGNIWVPNYQSSSISKFDYTGTPLSGSTGFGLAGLDNPTSVAIDIYGNAWVANYNGNSISEFSNSGVKISGPPGFTGSGLNQPYGISIDSVGHTWIANFGGNNLSEFTAAGAALSGGSGFTTDSLVGPAGTAGDTAGNIWGTIYGGTSGIFEAVPSTSLGVSPTFTFFNGGGLNSPYGIAIDGSGNVWVANQGGNGSVSKFDSSGNAVSGANGYTNAGIDVPYGIAVDGAGNVWTANYGGDSNSISEISSTGGTISTNGYVSNSILKPYGIAIDSAGNVWVACDNGSNALAEFVGAAVPVVTPLTAGAEYKELGTRP